MEISGKRFLVTGGSGFVGSHVVDALVSRAPAEIVVFDSQPAGGNLERSLATGLVRVVEGDITAADEVERAIEGVDGVFHLAVLPLGRCEAEPRRCLDVNVVGSFNVFDAARRGGVRKVVFSSASSVYGDTNETMDEAHPLNARTMYGASKIAGEYILHALAVGQGFEYVILRYMNVYGPRQAGGLVPAAVRRLRAGERPTIMGDGSQSFDFVYVVDVADANVRAMASDVSGETFNVGSATEVTVREVVEELIRLSGSDVEPEFQRDATVLMTRRVGRNARAVERLDWRPAHSLTSGLRSVLDADGHA